MKLNRLIIISLLLQAVNLLEARPIKLAQRYDNEQAIAREFEQIYKELNAIKFVVLASSPVVVATGTKNIEDGQAIFYSTGTVGVLYFRVGNQLFYEEFNKK